MTSLIKLVVLLCASVAVFANPIELNELEIETSFLEDVIDPFATKIDQSVTIGKGSWARLLYRENVDVKAAPNQIKERRVTYNPDRSSAGGLITFIQIHDMLNTGKNAAYKIISGGVDQRFITIDLKSQKGQPIKYVVQIFGV